MISPSPTASQNVFHNAVLEEQETPPPPREKKVEGKSIAFLSVEIIDKIHPLILCIVLFKTSYSSRLVSIASDPSNP